LLRLRLRNFAQNRRMANDTFVHWSFFHLIALEASENCCAFAAGR
jgi:hypothetical protein